MQSLSETLQLSDILLAISKYSVSEVGKERINALSILPLKELKEEKAKLEEAEGIVSKYSYFPLSPSKSALKIIEIAHKSGLLSPLDLMNIYSDIALSEELIKFYTGKVKEDDYPYISALVTSFYDLSPLMKEIKRCISSSLTILSSASPELKKIREEIKKKEASLEDKVRTISSKYSALLSEENLTLRDGHYVLPVKTAYKNKITGIVYDVSQSGNTTFIEPIEIVELNNELSQLRREEKDEERKVLLTLTNLCLLNEEEILSNNEVIGELDFLMSKVRFGEEIKGISLPISEKKIISLNGARHPLIDPLRVVANSFLLDTDNQIIIISGPNAGGKTVSLKTVGLLVYMNECALPIPIDSGELSYFNHIYLDIGDQQSLMDNLSTFSAHISNISEILSVVTDKDLVLIDELGTGTDPDEGAALAVSITKYLLGKGAMGLISSHFSLLKEYAYKEKGLTNGSMIFNEEKLSPTYVFKEGIPGKSYAYDVASRYGIKKEIINEARGLTNDDSEPNVILDELEKTLHENLLLEDSLRKKEEALSKKERELENESKRLDKRKMVLLEEAEKDKKALIKESEDEIKEIMDSLNKPGVKLNDVIEAKGKLNALKEEETLDEFDDEINVNDYISVPSLSLEGRVVSIRGEKLTVLTSEGLSVNLERKKAKKIDPPKRVDKASANVDLRITASLPLELNLIGYHVEEAITALDKYLDEATIHKVKSVRIIHGYGSGALRSAIWEHLKTRKGISYRYGNDYEGSMGATIITFDD
ncbi:MAG: Smr/MutS family protein [Coprobacillus sp.]|nr:Smr/MutS family protein [Coprobacillus sp.]